MKKERRGRKKGSCKKLSPDDLRYIINYLACNTPFIFESKSVLWTRMTVRQFINSDLDIKISKSTLASYFYSLDLVVSRSIKGEYRKENRKRKDWLWEEYPYIKKEAQKQNAVVWWGNLKLVRQKESRRVNKPFLKSIKYIMLYIVIENGINMFSIYTHKTLTYIDLIDFLQKIIETADKKVFLLLPIRKVYPVKSVNVWLAKHHNEIELIYVPRF